MKHKHCFFACFPKLLKQAAEAKLSVKLLKEAETDMKAQVYCQ